MSYLMLAHHLIYSIITYIQTTTTTSEYAMNTQALEMNAQATAPRHNNDLFNTDLVINELSEMNNIFNSQQDKAVKVQYIDPSSPDARDARQLLRQLSNEITEVIEDISGCGMNGNEYTFEFMSNDLMLEVVLDGANIKEMNILGIDVHLPVADKVIDKIHEAFKAAIKQSH